MVMYPTLRAEIARKGVKVSDISKKLKISRVALYNKMNGKTYWKVSEAIEIQAFLNADIPLEVLFAKE